LQPRQAGAAENLRQPDINQVKPKWSSEGDRQRRARFLLLILLTSSISINRIQLGFLVLPIKSREPSCSKENNLENTHRSTAIAKHHCLIYSIVYFTAFQ